MFEKLFVTKRYVVSLIIFYFFCGFFEGSGLFCSTKVGNRNHLTEIDLTNNSV